MLVELLRNLQRLIRSALKFLFFTTPMTAKALPVNSEVEYANYKMFRTSCDKAKSSLNKAITADEKRVDKTNVITLYKKAISDVLMALKIRSCSCPANKINEIETERDKLSKHLELAQDRLIKLEGVERCDSSQSIAIVVPKTQQTSASSTIISRPTVTVRTQKFMDKNGLMKNVNSKFGEEIFSTILPTTDIKMSSVEGNAAAKIALEESVVLPSLNPKLFTGLRAPCKGILLFGPPGNGKTMLAKAIANECQSTFFNISAATIMSKWVGDGERMVQALFQMARNAQPSIIFIDEVDSMLCERSESENAAARRVKTEFLIQLDGCSAKSDDRILILAATNRPYELDEGILRRFPKRIFIDLPDRMARANMIKRTFEETNTPVSLRNKDFEYLASRTEGYSYSDLDALCRTAALIPLRSVSRSMVPRITASQLRPINLDDFDEALQNVKPSLNQDNRDKLLGFARNYAQMS